MHPKKLADLDVTDEEFLAVKGSSVWWAGQITVVQSAASTRIAEWTAALRRRLDHWPPNETDGR
jgi:hypothetical protein